MENNSTPQDQELKGKAAILDLIERLSHVEAQAAAGLPVYEKMAASIERRRDEQAAALVREALNPEGN